MALTDFVGSVKGIGPKKAALFARLSLETLEDVLLYYPRDYEDCTRFVPVAQAQAGGKVCLCAVVSGQPITRLVRKGMDITQVRVFDPSGAIWVTFYNAQYMVARLQEGHQYIFYGRIQGQGAQRTLVSPKCIPVAPHTQPPRRVIPVYSLTAGLTQKDFIRVTDAALAAQQIYDWMPQELVTRYHLPTRDQAIRAIHRPRSLDEVSAARRRIIFEELFLLCCGMAKMKIRRVGQSGLLFEQGSPNDIWKRLSFCPTDAQRRVAQDIWCDVRSGQPMNRLVQGDVGSGKTVLAAVLCSLSVTNGYQAAIMAPTEILAAQHMEFLAPLFAVQGIRCMLLTGSLSAVQKRLCKQQIASGEVDIIIGTHALITDDVNFHKLGAIVVDEQHRFGVLQRARLHHKGEQPHILVMSATPIPRTLALIVYGDLDISVVDELPPGRLPVETYAVGENMRPRIYAFIEKQLKIGGQVYVVCPLVEQGESSLRSAQEHANRLRQVLPQRRIGLLHGRVRPADKDAIMREFAAGKIDVLVCTTVIEVGVNVPNACLMVIEDADRFGLSQLHQLRGRVGRGNRKSYCICFGADKGAQARERLKTLCSTNDGFEIAYADLAQRGPGDFFGKRQHGLPALRMANLAQDFTIMQYAKKEATALLARDPELSHFPALRMYVEQMFQKADGEIFNSL